MRKIIIFSITVSIILGTGIIISHAQQHMGPGMMGPGYGYHQQGQWNYCPNCGSYLGHEGYYGRGPAMRGQGYGMGPGMMNGGQGMGPGGMYHGWGMGQQYGQQYGPGYQGRQSPQAQKPMEEKDAKQMLKNYLDSTRNPNLKLGEIEDKGETFEAEIKTKEGSLVDKIIVDKRTGWMRSAY
jgi:hypothetical protein